MAQLDRFVSIILSADIVGYTSLMQDDEQNALSVISRFEMSIASQTKQYGGEVIKNYGDGSLILFSSAVKAIHCAIAIQDDLNQAPSIPLRIGIHIGEIVRKGSDIFGHGVNIASRIESMGTPGSVLISGAVYQQIKNQSEIELQSIGSFKFKNVDGAMDLYAITNGALAIPLVKDMKGKGSPEEKRNTLSRFRNTALSLMLFIIICLAAFYWFNQTNKTDKETITSNVEALDLFLKGDHHQRLGSRNDIDSAISFYHKAVLKDPEFAMAYSKLASAYMRKHLFFDPNMKWENEAYAAAGKALFFNPELADPHITRGQFYWSESHNFAHEEAINEYLLAIDKDPTLSLAHEQLALVQVHIGLYDEALKNARKSISLDPGNFRVRRVIAEVFLFKGEYETSLQEFEKIPKNFALQHAQSLKVLNLYYLHQIEKATVFAEEGLSVLPKNPNLNSVNAILKASQNEEVEAEKYIAIAIANAKDYIHAHHIYYHLAIANALMNKKEEACIWLNKAAASGFPNYPLYNSDPSFSTLRGHPAFEELLNELKTKFDHFKSL